MSSIVIGNWVSKVMFSMIHRTPTCARRKGIIARKIPVEGAWVTIPKYGMNLNRGGSFRVVNSRMISQNPTTMPTDRRPSAWNSAM